MEMKDFFYFSCKPVLSTVQVSARGRLRVDDERGINDYNDLIRGKYENINFPVIFNQVHGKKLTDILGTGWPNLLLISDKLKEVLEENHFTGWKAYPIKVYDKKKNEILGYHGFSITGRSNRPIYDKSPILERRYVPTGPIVRYYKGISIDLDKWDGSDFFMPYTTLFIFITKKVATILKKHKITNMDLENFTDMEMDVR